MKVLWLCNLMIPRISKALNLPEVVYGGWLTGLSNDLLSGEDIQLAVCFPHSTGKVIKGTIDSTKNLVYYGFPRSIKNYYMYDKKTESYLRHIVEDCKPDLIHIFGTEYPHTLAMVKVCKSLGMEKRLVITLQGLMTACKEHYDSGLPLKVIYGYTIRDFLVQNNVRQIIKRFKRNAEFEKTALRQVYHVIGRTDFDKGVVYEINPKISYYHCNETLRDSFYENKWELKRCNRYSIFISQANYPMKGFHRVLEALPYIIKEHPDCHVYIAGKDITKHKKIADKFRITTYGSYIARKIKKKKLSPYITFLGVLQEEQMMKEYLKAHVFLSASSMENSPNSLSEALLLGVPCVSSYVGGVSNLLIHNTDGFLYQHDAPYMLGYYVNRIFSDDELAKQLSLNARTHGKNLFDRQTNLNTIKDIYYQILSNQSLSKEHLSSIKAER